jgi:hypothetical protein
MGAFDIDMTLFVYTNMGKKKEEANQRFYKLKKNKKCKCDNKTVHI